MIWFLESHSFLVAVSASFLFGILLDMLLKKLTGSEKIGYVAGGDARRRHPPPYLLERMERLYMHLPVF